MNEDNLKRLQANYTFIKDNIEVTPVSDLFYQNGLISEEQHAKLDCGQLVGTTRFDTATTLLKILRDGNDCLFK